MRHSNCDPPYPLLFWHYHGDDTPKLRKRLCHAHKGPHLYYRRMKTAIQARYAELVDHQTIPRVFLCGNPHIDNYAITPTGCGLLDFDRAYIGPYSWDIVCLLLSLALKQATSQQDFLPESIIQDCAEAYCQGFNQPEAALQTLSSPTTLARASEEQSMSQYLMANKKWAKKMRAHPIALDTSLLSELLQQYLASRAQTDILHHFNLMAAGRCVGTFGRPRFLLALHPHEPEQADAILLDIKVTKDYLQGHWPHLRWYHHAYTHEAKRVIAARRLYAPHCDQSEGYARLCGEHYWGRYVPCLNRKIKHLLDLTELMHCATVLGQQLGRGHRLSLQGQTPSDHLRHFAEHYSENVACVAQMQQELLLAHQAYCTQ